MGLCLSLKYVNLNVPLGIILMLWVVLRCLVVGVVCLQPPRTECWRLGIGGDSGGFREWIWRYSTLLYLVTVRDELRGCVIDCSFLAGLLVFRWSVKVVSRVQ